MAWKEQKRTRRWRNRYSCGRSPIPIERRTAWIINNHTEWERFRAELQEVVDMYSSTVGETNQDKSNDINSKYTQLIRRIKEAAVATIGEYTIKPNTDYTRKDPAVKYATKRTNNTGRNSMNQPSKPDKRH